uniref:Pyruvate, phosphate dikinase n=1 Tax=Magnetococcus massalia (strain MO-1) TaxID=451514 RepID=A0A1S7LF46_MAGMO|nr:pyruvate phosphate dikinase [Candidatus Magnetococcus massalia]
MVAQGVFFFGDGQADGSATMKALLGGKGANLAEMTRLGIPVPPGFTLSTEICSYYQAHHQSYPATLQAEVRGALDRVEAVYGARFGDPAAPLLLSVRSGARVSMPGMMDTVLNIGLNPQSVEGLIANGGNQRFAYDAYRRLLHMYGDVVLGVSHERFMAELDQLKQRHGCQLDTEVSGDGWAELVGCYRAIIEEEIGKPFPDDPMEQLWGAIGAVFRSWNVPRARTYRRLNGYPEAWGTAVNVQAMVFGNMGDDCATGVAFTRDPATGEHRFYGEYLVNAQGEDVVAGIRTPGEITLAGKQTVSSREPAMEERMPELFGQLMAVQQRLEQHYRDMQDLEFTIQNGKLWLLQTRNGKRTAPAALRIAVEMVKEGLIDEKEAVLRVDASALSTLLHPTLDPAAERDVIVTGLAASPGAAAGHVVFSADVAERLAGDGKDVILVRSETSPEDIHGMHAARGIVTARGGRTSHAAVVARGMGTPCVAGCGEMEIHEGAGFFRVGKREVHAGEWITIDGGRGEVMVGRIPTREPELSGDFAILMGWADQFRRMKVRANADTPTDAKVARSFGAEGIGLCRTEHMFFDATRITAVRQMILAEDAAERQGALDKILPMQEGDFFDLFQVMDGLPVTIRLLDPPLHEFLPQDETGQREVASGLGIPLTSVKERVQAMHELNPMLGHRGCRLGISHPEIYAMQVRAIAQAACRATEAGGDPQVEVMIPLVGTVTELAKLKKLCQKIIGEVVQSRGVTISPLIGTMIELPRAALTADALAEEAAFFSFGTNDLTQTAMGLSRDDSATFLRTYLDQGILVQDPFASIDVTGVGQLVAMACDKGRAVRPDIHLGVCGEHGGNPPSIQFFEQVGLDYVSCSPFRVPVARLAAAQAFLQSP